MQLEDMKIFSDSDKQFAKNIGICFYPTNHIFHLHK